MVDFIENQINSLLITGIGFIFTGTFLFLTKNCLQKNSFSDKSALSVGFMQVLALLPGVSRSGMTISTAKFFGINNKDSFKFSFLILIPLAFGATILEIGKIDFSFSVLFPFFVCLILSLLFLSVLEKIMEKNNFWMFSIYCFIIGIVTLILHFFR